MKFEQVADHAYCIETDDRTEYIFRGEVYTGEETCLAIYNDFLSLNPDVEQKISVFLRLSTGLDTMPSVSCVEFSSKRTEDVRVSFDVPVHGRSFSYAATMFGAICGKVEIEMD